MIHTLEMTVLIDNVAVEPLVGEWGLSILIAADDRRILLDTGASHLFAQNAERLGIDLDSVDTGVLSHAHYDHSDGMDTFFCLNRKAPFLVREGACENCFGIKDGVLHYIGIQSGVLKQHESWRTCPTSNAPSAARSTTSSERAIWMRSLNGSASSQMRGCPSIRPSRQPVTKEGSRRLPGTGWTALETCWKAFEI